MFGLRLPSSTHSHDSMKIPSTLLALGLALLGACATPLPQGLAIGEPMATGQVERFSVVDATPADFFDRTVLVRGRVTEVCIKKGCWMQIEDEGKTAMVRWESGCGGKYAFPQEAVGKSVLIQGSFYPKELTEADREHLIEEAGGELDIRSDPYEFNASAILILDEQ